MGRMLSGHSRRRRSTAGGAGVLAALLIALTLAPASPAAPGDLDPSFADGGMLTIDLGLGLTARPSDVLVQPDGQIVTVGSVGESGWPDNLVVTRHHPNGTLDTTFADDGIQATAFNGDGSGRAGVLQADGKLVVVGGRDAISEDDQDQWVVARYNSNGTLDTNFSDDGKQTFRFNGVRGFPAASDVAVLPDGKILIVGAATDGDDYPTGLGIARLGPNGSLDPTFSEDGKRTIDLFESYDQPRLALLPDGKFAIAAIGFEPSGPVGHLQVSRLTADGSFDNSFSENGQQMVVLSDFETVIGFDAQPDGKLVAAVGTFDLEDPDPTVVLRFSTNGTLDTSFSGDGQQPLTFGDSYYNGGDLLLRPDGKLTVSVASGIAQLTPDGELDPSFSDDGLVYRDNPLDSLGRAALDANGSVLVTGSLDGDLALLRYLGEPLPDDTTPPETTITLGPSGTASTPTPTFGFSSSEPDSTFECRVDDQAFASCTSPHTAAPLSAGSHVFEVRAIDSSGNADPTPGSRSFSVEPASQPPLPGPTDSKNQPPKPKPSKASPPRITGASLAASKITSKQRPTLHFKLSTAARVSVRVLKPKAGLRKGKRCVKPSKQASGKRCALQVASLSRSLGAGAHKLRLSKLKAGRYLLTISTTDNASQRSVLSLRVGAPAVSAAPSKEAPKAHASWQPSPAEAAEFCKNTTLDYTPTVNFRYVRKTQKVKGFQPKKSA